MPLFVLGRRIIGLQYRIDTVLIRIISFYSCIIASTACTIAHCTVVFKVQFFVLVFWVMISDLCLSSSMGFVTCSISKIPSIA